MTICLLREKGNVDTQSSNRDGKRTRKNSCTDEHSKFIILKRGTALPLGFQLQYKER